MKSFKGPFLLFILSCGLLFPFLGAAPLFDWDEINFAESAREMLLTQNYTRVQINFQPFWEKPPLFFWLQALSMRLFGMNEFSARFPNAVFGVITILTLYYLGKKHYKSSFGWFWALCYLGSFLPLIYFKSGIIDPIFNYFIFTSLVCVAELHRDDKQIRLAILGGILLGLAVLTKGPTAILVLLLCVLTYWLIKRFKGLPNWKPIALYAISAFLVASVWFGFEVIKNGHWFLQTFIEYQIRLFSTPDAGHEQPFFYHPLVLLIGCFPASLFVFAVFRTRKDNPTGLKIWMGILFWVVLIFFSIVKTKIIHYSSLCYLPLTFLAAYSIDHLLNVRHRISKWLLVPYLLIGIFFVIAFAAVPYIGLNKEIILPLIKDPFAQANFEADVNWQILDYLPAILWLIILIVGSAFIFKKDIEKGINILFLGMAVSVFFFSFLLVDKISAFTQGAPVTFFQNLKGKDVYVDVLGYKSYAHYFYFEKPGMSSLETQNAVDSAGIYNSDLLKHWYLFGKIDKPVYFSCKITKVKDYKGIPGLVELYRQNGFVFYKRMPEE